MKYKTTNDIKKKSDSSQKEKITNNAKSNKIDDVFSGSDCDSECTSLVEVKSTDGLDINNSLFRFGGKKFPFIKVNGEFYFKGKEIAEALGYADTDQAIRDHVSEEYRIKLEDIFRPANLAGLKSGDIFRPPDLGGLKMGNVEYTIYIKCSSNSS